MYSSEDSNELVNEFAYTIHRFFPRSDFSMPSDSVFTCVEEPWRSALLKVHRERMDSMHDSFGDDKAKAEEKTIPEVKPIPENKPSQSSRGQLITTRWISEEAERSIDKFNETYIPETDEEVMSSPRDLAKKTHIMAKRRSREIDLDSSQMSVTGFPHGVPQYSGPSSSRVDTERRASRPSSDSSGLQSIPEDGGLTFMVREQTPGPVVQRYEGKSRPVKIQFGETDPVVYGKSTPENIIDLNSPVGSEHAPVSFISGETHLAGNRSASVQSIIRDHQSPDGSNYVDNDLNQYIPRDIPVRSPVKLRAQKAKKTKVLVSASQCGLTCLPHQTLLFNKVRKIWEPIGNHEVVDLLESLMYSRYQEIYQ
jgi:hypothetical protein